MALVNGIGQTFLGHQHKTTDNGAKAAQDQLAENPVLSGNGKLFEKLYEEKTASVTQKETSEHIDPCRQQSRPHTAHQTQKEAALVYESRISLELSYEMKYPVIGKIFNLPNEHGGRKSFRYCFVRSEEKTKPTRQKRPIKKRKKSRQITNQNGILDHASGLILIGCRQIEILLPKILYIFILVIFPRM